MTWLPTVEVNQVCAHAEAGGEQEQRDHDGDEAPQQRHVGRPAVDREERVVEDALHDQRGDDRDRRAGDDEDAGEDERTAVGAEERDHPPAEVRDRGRRGVEPLLRLDVDAAEARVAAAAAASAAAAHAHPCRSLMSAADPAARADT